MGINKDQVAGRAKEAGGKIQQEVGKLTGDKSNKPKALQIRWWARARQRPVILSKN